MMETLKKRLCRRCSMAHRTIQNRAMSRMAIASGLLSLCMVVLSSGAAVANNAMATQSFDSADSAQKMSSEQIRDAANNVMQQNDFRSVRRRLLENTVEEPQSGGFLQDIITKMAESVADFFAWVFSGFGLGGNRTPAAPASTSSSSSGGGIGLGTILLYLALMALVAIAIWIIAAVVKTSDGRRKTEGHGLFDEEGELADLNTPPGELAASTYESRAMQMADTGNYRGAVRELLIGSMSWIERSGFIRFRKGLTNRDYVRAIWRHEERRMAYAKTAVEFERIYFGRREATQETFNDCLSSFQGSFREEETTPAV